MVICCLYQVLLDAAQSLSVSDRVTFTPVGIAEDGYTSAVIEVHDHSTGIVLDSYTSTTADETPTAIAASVTASSDGSDDAGVALSPSEDSKTEGTSVKRLSYAPQKRKVFSLRVGMVRACM